MAKVTSKITKTETKEVDVEFPIYATAYYANDRGGGTNYFYKMLEDGSEYMLSENINEDGTITYEFEKGTWGPMDIGYIIESGPFYCPRKLVTRAVIDAAYEKACIALSEHKNA